MLILSGLALGLILGYSLERSGFCMNTAFRSIIFDKDRSVLRAYILALIITTAGVAILELTRWIFPLRSPFSFPALLIGGYLFGLGMVVAGGCVSGTFYRSGRGMLGSGGALVAFAASASIFSSGPLAFISEKLNSYQWTLEGEEPAFYHLFSFSGSIDPFAARWIWIAILVIAGGWFLIKAPKEEFLLGWSWKKSGLIIGLIAMAAWWVSGLFFRDYGLSFTQPTVSISRFLVNNDSGGINWASYMVMGVLGGAFLGSLIHGDFAWRIPKAGRMMQQFAGGFVMGAGASIAGGCNIGHGLTGISAQSLASLTATIFTILGVWTSTALIYRKQRRQQ